MRSFALSALAFLTLGVFSSAAPTPVDANSNTARSDSSVNVLHRAASTEDKGLGSILNGVVSEIEPIIEEISKLFYSRILSSCY